MVKTCTIEKTQLQLTQNKSLRVNKKDIILIKNPLTLGKLILYKTHYIFYLEFNLIIIYIKY